MSERGGVAQLEQEYQLVGEDRKRFARLVARAWSEPDMARRYEEDPRGVLAEFGVELAAWAVAPRLPRRQGDEFDVSDLGTAAGGLAGTIGCFSCPTASVGTIGG
jgi:putative thiazole/oxazole-modified microcin (TOMM)-like peptide